MKDIDLQFWKSLDGGRKEHYIFKQQDTFYIITESDKGNRGRFHAIDQNEIDEIRIRLFSKMVPKQFRPSAILRLIQYPEFCKKMGYVDISKDSWEEYCTDRLTRICYILSLQGYLIFEKFSGANHFLKNKPIEIISQKKAREAAKSKSENFTETKVQAIQNLLKLSSTGTPLHLQGSRRNKRTKCPYCQCVLKASRLNSHLQSRCPEKKRLIK